MHHLINFIVTWAIITVAILIVGAVIPGVKVEGVKGAIVIAAIFGIVNFLLGWLLAKAPGLDEANHGWIWPGIKYWITNIILLKITDWLTKKLTITGFLPAVLAGLVMAILLTAGMYLRGTIGA